MSAKANGASSRKARRAERQRAASRIMPPEGVELALPIAGLGARIGAQIADILITLGFAISLLILLVFSEVASASTLTVIGSLLFFLIRVPYYILTELAWNGQTLGKRLMKIKVVSHFGGPLTTHALVLRNILKEAEIFLPATLVLTLTTENPIASWLALAWVVMALAIPLSNPHRMRLGDMLAGTHVVHLPDPILLSDLATTHVEVATAEDAQITFLAHQLDHYGRFELQTLEALLRVQDGRLEANQEARNAATLASIVERIRKKIGYSDAVAPEGHVAFLRAFYNAQRAHLEQRQIFGDRRSDKHHRAESDGNAQ
ncbi:MAG: RDD family protein [Pseudomonadota bacterium]